MKCQSWIFIALVTAAVLNCPSLAQQPHPDRAAQLDFSKGRVETPLEQSIAIQGVSKSTLNVGHAFDETEQFNPLNFSKLAIESPLKKTFLTDQQQPVDLLNSLSTLRDLLPWLNRRDPQLKIDDSSKLEIEAPTKQRLSVSKRALEESNPQVKPGDVHWHKDLSTACDASQQSGKPVLLFHLLGQLDQQFT